MKTVTDKTQSHSAFIETKVFKNGNSQAVRIPKDFALADLEKPVFIMKNAQGALVITTEKPIAPDWAKFFSFLTKHQEELSHFMLEREDTPPLEKELF